MNNEATPTCPTCQLPFFPGEDVTQHECPPQWKGFVATHGDYKGFWAMITAKEWRGLPWRDIYAYDAQNAAEGIVLDHCLERQFETGVYTVYVLSGEGVLRRVTVGAAMVLQASAHDSAPVTLPAGLDLNLALPTINDGDNDNE